MDRVCKLTHRRGMRTITRNMNWPMTPWMEIAEAAVLATYIAHHALPCKIHSALQASLPKKLTLYTRRILQGRRGKQPHLVPPGTAWEHDVVAVGEAVLVPVEAKLPLQNPAHDTYHESFTCQSYLTRCVLRILQIRYVVRTPCILREETLARSPINPWIHSSR